LLGGKCGVINSKNQIVIPIIYDALILDLNTDGFNQHEEKFVVKIKDKWTYLDLKGKILKINAYRKEILNHYAPWQDNSDFKYIEGCMIDTN
jgi:hypothetical protein